MTGAAISTYRVLLITSKIYLDEQQVQTYLYGDFREVVQEGMSLT